MGNCLPCCKKKNVLIEIRWPKDYWTHINVAYYANLTMLGGCLLDLNVFSQYHTMIYRDKRRYKNLHSVVNKRDHVIWVYGDQK
jgi:hypothetical protein